MDILSGFLEKHPEVTFLQLRWLSFSAILHSKFITVSSAKYVAAGERQYYTNQSGMVMPIATAPQCEIDRVMRCPIEPDWKSLQLCSFTPGHASVMCSIAVEGEENPYLQCPRRLLQETLAEIQTIHQTTFLVGFEIEFSILNAAFEPVESIDPVINYCMNAGLRGKTLKIVEEICYALEKANIGVFHFHTEDPNQLEIALIEKPPMEAIDGMVFACEAIRAIAAQHDLKATVTPKPIPGTMTNGLHLHLSAHGMTNYESFLAGIMDKLSAMTIFGVANYDGFERVKGGKAGELVGWGTEHRDFPLRKIDESHWELRCVDVTANFYLFLAVVLKAAMAGVSDNKVLIQKDIQKWPKDITEAEWAEKYGVTERLPRSLKEAIEIAKRDPVFAKWIGQYMLDRYIRIKELEVEAFEVLTDEQRRNRFVKFF